MLGICLKKIIQNNKKTSYVGKNAHGNSIHNPDKLGVEDHVNIIKQKPNSNHWIYS
jgi:hypothetical protein